MTGGVDPNFGGLKGLRASIVARVGALEIDVAFETRGTLALIGPNGAGKTSLLLLLLGVLPAKRGRVEVDEAVLFDSAARIDVPLERRGLGYVPQEYALFPHLTVRQNIEFALASKGETLTKAERAEGVERLLGELALEAQRERRPEYLSGGEKQRVALARALAVRPRALLLDEPLAALDIHARREVREFLRAYLQKLALPTLVVTHDAEDAKALGENILLLEAGKVVQVGTWSELVAGPKTHFAEEFVRSGSAR